MVRVPAGSFTRGSSASEAGRFDTEGPQHRVTIGTAFSLAKYEVTRGEFAAFVLAAGHRAAGDWRNPGFAQTDRHPVVNVSWNDAKAYVAWLSKTSGKPYRLPSGAEWEYAARAGTTTARYWGERHQEACRYANVDDASHGCRDGHANTAPVGTFLPNAFGLHDMLGNVWEWTEDCGDGRYAGAPVDGSPWSGPCSRREVRGGSWGDIPRYARAAVRISDTAGSHVSLIGFRVARTD
jgi:formylglycine-generating enzyme required for sulfatase activity